MIKNSERGGAVLITTILILMISAVIAMSLLNSASVGSKVSGNYKLQGNAFNVAEAGFEKVRNQLLSFATVKSRVFCDTNKPKKFYDPNFNLYSEFDKAGSPYAIYYGKYPGFKGTMPITLPDGQTLTGKWYVRIIDNDLVCNKPLGSGYVDDHGYLDTSKITKGDGIMLNCQELNNDGAGACNLMPTINFSKDYDFAVFVESRGIITDAKGKVLASRLVRVLIRVGKTSGGGRNPSQKGGAAGGTRSNISGGTAPIGYGN